MFDGLRSVWGTTNNGIVQLDIVTYAANVNVGASDLGTSILNMDQKYIYAVSRNRNTQPKIYRFWRANGNLAAHMNVGSALGAVTNFGRPVPDYKGFVYAVTQHGAQGQGSGTARQIVWSSESANANVGVANQNFSTSTNQPWQTSFYYEVNTDRMYFFTNENGTGRTNIS